MSGPHDPHLAASPRLPLAGCYVDEIGRPYTVSLDDCHREPIGVPNLTQPHGVLIAVSRDDFVVRQASDNTHKLLGRDASDLIDKPLADVFGRRTAALVRGRARRAEPGTMPVCLCTVSLGGTRYDVLGHVPERADGLLVLELEPAGSRGVRPDVAGDVRGMLQRLYAAPDTAAFTRGLVERVQAVTGFDRVMLYRFDAQYNGEVVDECIRPGRQDTLETFLGLHYPASDIPDQARDLYIRNWVRLIPDVTYTPVPLVPGHNPRVEGGRVDLSYATLRSVSPLHVEYLRNMGVSATLTVSLLDLRGRDGVIRPPAGGTTDDGPHLWGLLACHHYAGTHYLPFDVRSVCEILARMASLHLSTRNAGQASRTLADRRGVQTRLITAAGAAVDADAPFEPTLVHGNPSLHDLIAADTTAVVTQGDVLYTPDDQNPINAEHLRAIARWACEQAFRPGKTPLAIVHTDRLTSATPEFAGDDVLRLHASGVLAVPLSAVGDALLWLRPEQVRDVHWAGNPDKAIEFDATGQGIRLSPRKSFARWRQELRGRSVPWDDDELAVAREFRDALADLVIRRADRVHRLNQQLASSNAELDAFAYAAAHDLREPLRGIASLAAFTLEDFGDTLEPEAADNLGRVQRLAVRMDALVRSLLDYARLGNTALVKTELSLDDVLDDVRERLGDQIRRANATLHADGPLPTIRGDRERVTEVLQNLVSNAIKYNNDTPRIDVGTGFMPEGLPEPALFVRDNGIGIDPHQRNDVFRIFRRLHATDAYGGGTGAGLTICRNVVERHGGRILAAPNNDGSPGTTFWFHFGPMAAPAPHDA